MVTGMRGLCNGLGPAMFGLIFYMFHVDLNEGDSADSTHATEIQHPEVYSQLVPGPPFVFGAFLVVCALLVASFIPTKNPVETSIPMDSHYEIERGHKVAGTLSPLISSSRSLENAAAVL